MSFSATRAVLRISRRNIWRNRWRSALIVLLVALPVAAMVGATTLLITTTPSSEEAATRQLGRADLLAFPREQATREQLADRLPAGSVIEPISSMSGQLVLPGRRVEITVRALNLDGLARGMLTSIGGRLPAAAGEVAISRGAAALAGADIGDSIEMDGWGQSTVVGFIENPGRLSERVVLLDPSLAEQAAGLDEPDFLIGLPPGYAGPPPDPAGFHTRSRDDLRAYYGMASAGVLVLGALVMIETVLVAAAAFTVSIRRRQRELGILAAVGAHRRQLAGTVVGEGLWLGGLGSIIGAVVGFAAIVAVSPWLDELANRRNPPVSLDVTATLAAIGLGVAATLIASAIPAWTAARLPVLTALSGRRPPFASARRVLLLGVGLITLASSSIASGAVLRLDYSMNEMSTLLLAGGAIVGVLGFGACSPWLIERFEHLGRRLPFTGRVALRDTARARSRTAPIVTAMLSSLALTVALAAYTSSSEPSVERSKAPWLRADQLALSGAAASTQGPEVARQLGAIAGAPQSELVAIDGSLKYLTAWFAANGQPPPDRDNPCILQIQVEECGAGAVASGDRDLLVTLGAELGVDSLSAGKVVVLTEQPMSISWVGLETTEGQLQPDGTTEFRLGRTQAFPAVNVAAGHGPFVPGAIIPVAVAEQLGFRASTEYVPYLIRLDHPVTEADVAQAAALLADTPYLSVSSSVKEPDPNEIFRVALAVLSLLFALTVTAIAVALAESESRAEQRTLLAVGADPGIRRRLTAARAGVLALLAGLLAVPAGLLPVWGLLASRGAALIIPLLEVAAVVAVLPLAAIVGALLLSRPIPTWSAFRESAA